MFLLNCILINTYTLIYIVVSINSCDFLDQYRCKLYTFRMNIVKLKNTVQHYSWGTKDFIPGLLGIDNLDGEPFAELWMGSNPRGESLVEEKGSAVPLSELISRSADDVLGKNVSAKFGGSLPFLFKVLSAGTPLSIQAHPDKKAAEEGFRRENELGIPLDAFNRNYKDDNHKPEIICALTPFTAMCGFRSPSEIDSMFSETGSTFYGNQLAPLLKDRTTNGLRSFFTRYMKLSRDEVSLIIGEVITWAEKEESPEARLIVEFSKLHPGDHGVLSPLFLNVFELKPLQALYQGPGELHAYVRGSGIELMANSDNVLRGGMTSKNVDVDELLKILNFNFGKPQIIEAAEKAPCEFFYDTPVGEFLLERIYLDDSCSGVQRFPASAEIIICTEGRGEIKTDDYGLSFFRGDSFFIPASVSSYNLEGSFECFAASVPSDGKEGVS